MPDRAIGAAKGEGNAILGMFGVAPKFHASNAEQAETMQMVKSIEPELQTGLAMALPGPKSEKGEAGALLSKPEQIVNEIKQGGFEVTVNPKNGNSGR